MKTNAKICRHVVTMAGVIGGLFIVPVSETGAYDGSQVLPRYAYPFKKSYGDWTAEWWKWHFAIPAANHSDVSLDGANCGVGQSGDVWFLTGAFTTEVPENEFATIVRESCVVPTGKAIFFPVVNIECSTIEAPPFGGTTPEELLSCAESFVEGPNAQVHDLYVEIDGAALGNPEDYRFQSPAFTFAFDDEADNILGVDCEVVNCDDPLSVSDGYWVMVSPLSPGNHTIRFTGSFRDPGFGDDDNDDGDREDDDDDDDDGGDLLFGLDVTYLLTVHDDGP